MTVAAVAAVAAMAAMGAMSPQISKLASLVNHLKIRPWIMDSHGSKGYDIYNIEYC